MQKPIELLILSDSKDDSLFLINKLTEEGYAPGFRCVNTTKSLRKSILESEWDVIVTEHTMADLKSEEVIAIVNESTLDIPIIVVADKIGEESVAALIRSGAQDYVLRQNTDYLVSVISREVRDANIRRKLNDKQKATETKLRMLSTAIEQSRNIVFITDQSGRIEYVNQAFLQVTGWSIKEIIKKTPKFLEMSDSKNGSWYSKQMELRFSQVESNSWSGQIENMKKSGESFWALVSISSIRDEKGNITHLINVGEDLSELKQKESELSELAFFDPVTNLANKRLLDDRFNQSLKLASRHGKCVALFCLDLDKFKKINDTYGHGEGDRLLKNVGEILEDCVRKTDTVARVGGDEFHVLLAELDNELDARLVAHNIVYALKKRIKSPDDKVTVTTSLGIATFPSDGGDAKTLRDKADEALYEAKRCGRNTYKFYNKDIKTSMLRNIDLASDLNRALIQEEFTLIYSPYYSLSEYTLGESKLEPSGFELSLDWNHFSYGTLKSGVFLPTIRAKTLPLSIYTWIIRKLSIDIKKLKRLNHLPLRFVLNISYADITKTHLAKYIDNIMREFNMDYKCIELALNEDIFSNNIGKIVKSVSRLNKLGFKVSIDRFNNHTLSTDILSTLDVSAIRIDSQYVATMDEKTRIIAAIVSMAHNLNLKVAMTGINSKKQLEPVLDSQCDYVQGQYISPSMTLSDMQSIYQENYS